MKYSFFIILFCNSFFINDAFAQCLINSNFSNFCGTQTGGDCPTFYHPCLDNWWRSHGTPTYYTGTDETPNYNYVWMWASIIGGDLYGEGIFASYNFIKNHSYRITVTARATSSSGSFWVYATTGLVEPRNPSPNCGELIPTATKQFIMTQSPVVNGLWQTFSATFIPTDNYSQLWIYPTTSSKYEYDFAVRYVDACIDCQGTVIYNKFIIPTGNTKSGDIYAGSSAGILGAGTVTVSPTENTSLQAVNAVHLENEFHADVSTGTFLARIINCSDLNNLKIAKSNQSSEDTKIKSNKKENFVKELSANNKDSLNWIHSISGNVIGETNDISVFPIPSDGYLTISGNRDLKNADIFVFDQAGRVVYKSHNKMSTLIRVKLLHLSNGFYNIKIITPDGPVVTKKIIISK